MTDSDGMVNGVVDITNSLQNAILQAASGSTILLPAKHFLITKTIQIPRSITIKGVGDGITQIDFRAKKGALFFVKGVDGVLFQGLNISGKGLYSTSWQGSSNKNYERAILAYDVRNMKVIDCHITNFGKSAVTIFGGNNCDIKSNNIEGTHRFNTKLNLMDNYQFGIFIGVSPENGLNNITISNNEISFTTQGIISSQGKRGVHSRKIAFDENYIHDIIGQHGIYCSTSNTTIANNIIESIGLEGVKIQASHESLENEKIINNKINNCLNSQAINITEIHEGKNKITNVLVKNNDLEKCARGINLYGRLIDVRIVDNRIVDIEKEYAIYFRGFYMENILVDNIIIDNPMKEAIYISNDLHTKKIRFDNVTIRGRRSMTRPPIRVRQGNDIGFKKVDYRRNGKKVDKAIFISKNCRRIKMDAQYK